MSLCVLHVGKYFPPARGGMESFLADLVREQRAQGLDAHALVHGDPLPEDPDWLRRVPVQMELIFAPIAIGFRSALSKAIDEIQPDVLHMHMPNNAVFWALTINSAWQIPWVVHWHSDVLVSETFWALRLAYKIYRPFEQTVLDKAERIVVTSPPYLEASEPLMRWRKKCVMVPMALTVQIPEEVMQEIADTNWKPGTLKLLSIGRLTYYKDFETLIRAVCGARSLQLKIIGTGELRTQLQKLIKALTPKGQEPNVELLGDQTETDKHHWLASCDVFCLSSCERTEAFGLVLLEAMAHSKPCVVSDLEGSGMTWVVASSGAGLSHLPVGDVQAWQEGLCLLAQQPKMLKSWGQKGLQAVKDRFNISACARAMTFQYQIAQINPLPRPPNKLELILIPAKDEAETIAQLVCALKAAGHHHILVVDDNSSDGTGQIARNAGAQVVRPVLPLGAWGGMQLGIRYAWTHGYQSVVTMDADGQHEVEEIPLLMGAAQYANVVIGAHPQRASRLRLVAWRWFRFISGFALQDLTSGFRYYDRQAIELLAQDEATLLDYQDIGVLLILRKAGLRMVEVPVSMNTRLVGRSRIFNSWFSVAIYMLTTTLLCFARWEVPVKRKLRSH
jgi:glycosyltransferase involved in cell wall biosynthesis